MSDEKSFEERVEAWNKRFGSRGLDGWNKRIYRNDDDSFTEGNLGCEEFWNEFQIKSGPKFREACYSRIPGKWADDVRQMLKQAQLELGDKINYRQIKEKFCCLVVSFDAKDEEAEKRMNELISECQKRLMAKDLHP